MYGHKFKNTSQSAKLLISVRTEPGNKVMKRKFTINQDTHTSSHEVEIMFESCISIDILSHELVIKKLLLEFAFSLFFGAS